MRTPSVLIVTGEASGDLHGGNLVRAMKTLDNSLSFCGMGGEELANAGVKLLYDAARVSVVGVAEVITHLPDIWRAQRILRRHLDRQRPSLLIIIDLPDFNLMLAGYAKKLGIKVFYYITPQVWAWRSGRVKTIGERVDTLGVILPFEEQFFKERGLDAHYVGHPLLDSVSVEEDPATFRRSQGIAPERRCIGLIPGSRKREVASLLPIFLAAAEQLQRNADERFCFLIPLASTIQEEDVYAAGLDSYRDVLDVRLIRGQRYDLMASCDCVVAASGTVTLELALLERPMIVTYRLSPITYALGRLLVKLDHFSLVNLIAGRQVVPELLQDEVNPENISSYLEKMLFHAEFRSQVVAGLNEVRHRLGEKGASLKAARLALDILHGDENGR